MPSGGKRLRKGPTAIITSAATSRSTVRPTTCPGSDRVGRPPAGRSAAAAATWSGVPRSARAVRTSASEGSGSSAASRYSWTSATALANCSGDRCMPATSRRARYARTSGWVSVIGLLPITAPARGERPPT